MSRPFPFPERVPLQAVERLQQQFAGMLAALHTAADAAADEGHAPRLKKAHTLLALEQVRLEREAEAFRENERAALLQHAWDLRRLARCIDGTWAASADEELTGRWMVSQRLVVLTAWQISAAASGSEAAGL